MPRCIRATPTRAAPAQSSWIDCPLIPSDAAPKRFLTKYGTGERRRDRRDLSRSRRSRPPRSEFRSPRAASLENHLSSASARTLAARRAPASRDGRIAPLSAPRASPSASGRGKKRRDRRRPWDRTEPAARSTSPPGSPDRSGQSRADGDRPDIRRRRNRRDRRSRAPAARGEPAAAVASAPLRSGGAENLDRLRQSSGRNEARAQPPAARRLRSVLANALSDLVARRSDGDGSAMLDDEQRHDVEAVEAFAGFESAAASEPGRLWRSPQLRPGIVVHEPGYEIDALLAEFALTLRSRGFRVTGLVQTNNRGGAGTGARCADEIEFFDLAACEARRREPRFVDCPAARGDPRRRRSCRARPVSFPAGRAGWRCGGAAARSRTLAADAVGDFRRLHRQMARTDRAARRDAGGRPDALWSWWGPENLYRDLAAGVVDGEVRASSAARAGSSSRGRTERASAACPRRRALPAARPNGRRAACANWRRG